MDRRPDTHLGGCRLPRRIRPGRRLPTAEAEPPPEGVPAADRWAALEDPPFPLARLHSTAVWSGTEMVVWGGGSKDEHGSTDPTDGAAYQPGRAGSEAPCPSRPLYAD